MKPTINNLIQLIEIENIFSIRDRITIDFRAANLKTAKERELKDNIFMWQNKPYLKTIGLFGPNASGKTNIIVAIRACCQYILQGDRDLDPKLDLFPTFRYQNGGNKPSFFHILFVADGIEYDYSFTAQHNRFINEELYSYSDNNRKIKIFTRALKPVGNTYEYAFGNSIPKNVAAIPQFTAPFGLFLSRAYDMQQEWAMPIYRFFNAHFMLGLQTADNVLQPDLVEALQTRLITMLRLCDSDIQSIRVIKRTISPKTLNLPKNYANVMQSTEIKQVLLTHTFDPKKVFLWEEESSGTQQLIGLLLTLIPTLQQNKALLLDEFDVSMHTRITHFILDAINATQSSQFIFSSHDTSLISIDLFRRDQIYFVEKDPKQGCTSIKRLVDIKDFRETMDASKRYIAGHFGAVPHTPEDSNIVRHTIRKILYND